MSTKKEQVILTAEREPLPEVICIIIEELIDIALTSVINPERFDEVYLSHYPGDKQFTGISFYDDMTQLLGAVAISRMFREKCLEQQQKGVIPYSDERDAWEWFRKSNGLPRMHLHTDDSEERLHYSCILEYLRGFQEMMRQYRIEKGK